MIYDALLNGEEKALRLQARAFAREVDPGLLKRMDRDETDFPRDYYQALGRANLLGVRFPAEYGGRGMSWAAEIAALEEIGVLGMAPGCAFSMPSIVGEALFRFGSPEQKERFLRPMLAGELVAAEGLTEPRGGSDFFGAATRAQDRGDHFLLNGQKRFVVGASTADFFAIYARTGPKDEPRNSISLILVERERPGVEAAYLYGLMGARGGGTGRLLLRDVSVPKENLVGPLNGGALIFNTMMIPERLTSAGGALGLMRAALEVAARYTDRRRAFGRKIRKFQAVSFKTAEAVAKLDAARTLTVAAGRLADQGHASARRLVSQAKKMSTDAAWEVTNLAMQMAGGIGYTNVLPLERMVRDARLAQIWTGTNEIMNLLISHEYYKELLGGPRDRRESELDGQEAAHAEELVYTDEEMWTKGWEA